jgi:catechol 2,3-dioxygenase-like lactoylglutathione lyase family enzyme
MTVYAIDHVQIAMPPGGESQARAFYAALLGMTEIPKPQSLAGRGGVWFAAGEARLHLGVEREFHPARKAHPAFLVEDLDAVLDLCRGAGVSLSTDEPPLAGYRRAHVFDPFGNRVELMQRIGAEE